MKKKAIRRQLNTILANLEAMQVDLEEVLAYVPSGVGDPLPEPDIMPSTWTPGTGTRVNTPWASVSTTVDHDDLRTYEIMPDGTRRECEE